MIIALAEHKTLCCLIFNDGCAGIRANTPESMEDPERHASPPSEAPERSPEPVEEGRQRAAAAVRSSNNAPTLFSGKNVGLINTREDIQYYQRRPEPFMWCQTGTRLLELTPMDIE